MPALRRGGAARAGREGSKGRRGILSTERCEVTGPGADGAVVAAWTDDYVRFEKLPDWQKDLRAEIRRRCGQLVAPEGHIVHAEFFGPKLPHADVENLVLYNIDTFATAGRNGIRFEYGAAVPPPPDGSAYRFGYRYALAPRAGSFSHWQDTRTLASFGWTDLGAFSGEKKLAQVWWAISHASTGVGMPLAAGASFAVCVEVRPPWGLGREPVWGGLVKGIFDGVICAFHRHTGPLPPRKNLHGLAGLLGVSVQDIEELLNDPPWPVLGEVPGLVSAYRGGVKFAPSDHLCVAGELLAAPPEPGQDHWSITGRLVEVSR